MIKLDDDVGWHREARRTNQDLVWAIRRNFEEISGPAIYGHSRKKGGF